MTSSRQLMLISYATGARPASWAVHLRRFGWRVTLVTAGHSPALGSALRHLPAHVRVIRALDPQEARHLRETNGRDLSSVLQPDPQVLWNAEAIRAASNALATEPYDAVLVTAPPYSSLLVGAKLTTKFDVPLAIDLAHDTWSPDTSAPLDPCAWVAQALQRRRHRHALCAADALITASKTCADELSAMMRAANTPIPTTCVYDGYDPRAISATTVAASARDASPARTHDRTFRLVLSNTLPPAADVTPLVDAVVDLARRAPDLARRLEVVATGKTTAHQQAQLERLHEVTAPRRHPAATTPGDAHRRLDAPHAVCLIQPDVPNASHHVPVALFECLAAGRDVLGIAPAGECATLLDLHRPGDCCAPTDRPAIVRWLQRRLGATGPARELRPRRADAKAYFHDAQTARLAHVLDRLVHRACCRVQAG